MEEESRAFLGFSRPEGSFSKGLFDAQEREVGGPFDFLDLVEIKKNGNKSWLLCM